MEVASSFKNAWAKFKQPEKGPRETEGDGLCEFSRAKAPKRVNTGEGEATSLQPCFYSLFQGGHVGVEVATSAHEGLLASAGLLDSTSRLTNRKPCPPGPVLQGLVIDDYFVISQEAASLFPLLEASPSKVDTLAKRKLHIALAAYEEFGVAGSSEKDVVNACAFTVAGASVDSTRAAVRTNLVSVGSPAERRCALTLASLAAARLPVASLALIERLVGGWVHCMMYRRLPQSVLQRCTSSHMTRM